MKNDDDKMIDDLRRQTQKQYIREYNNTLEFNCDDGTIKAGDADRTEEEQREEMVEDLEDLADATHASLVQNVIDYEEKKAKILEEAKEVDTEDFLASKGIRRDED